MARPVRIRPSDFHVEHFDEVRVTQTASPDGLYFTTLRSTYYKGLRVFVTFPYSPSLDMRHCEYVGEVAAVDRISDHRHGIAIRFLMSLNPAA
jgi:hypothetical protein